MSCEARKCEEKNWFLSKMCPFIVESLEDPSSSQHCQKEFDKFYRKTKKSTFKISSRQQSVIKARLKLLMQIFFSVKSIYECVMDDESYFMVEGNEWQQQIYYESEDHPATEDVNFIRKMVLM
jgi:hypothetical protein